MIEIAIMKIEFIKIRITIIKIWIMIFKFTKIKNRIIRITIIENMIIGIKIF